LAERAGPGLQAPGLTAALRERRALRLPAPVLNLQARMLTALQERRALRLRAPALDLQAPVLTAEWLERLAPGWQAQESIAVLRVRRASGLQARRGPGSQAPTSTSALQEQPECRQAQAGPSPR
jgi:hypothetical protein